MSVSNTDKQWEKWGESNPYYGVLTEDRFLTNNLSESDKAEFFNSGREYIDYVLGQVKSHIDYDFIPMRAIDFGCGVGRLVIPLSEVSDEVIGIDVSPSMLNEAQKNCEERSVKNVKFIESDDRVSLLKGEFNFIHSFIVFQHVPVKRGEVILSHLLAHLKAGGVCAVHFTYAKPEVSALRKMARWVRVHVPLVKEIMNIVRGKNVDSPEMQMNPYDLNRLSVIMEENNVSRYYAEYVKHGGGIRGVLMYFQKEVDLEKNRPDVLNAARGN